MRVVEVRTGAGDGDGTVTLDETDRRRRRIQLTSDEGVSFLLDLPDARLLRDGDGLLLEDGRVITVRAAPEPLIEVRAANGRALTALAWQLGNRHLPAQIFDDRILIRQDHVIADMLRGLGADVRNIEAPFNPEAGAYAGAHHHHASGDDDA